MNITFLIGNGFDLGVGIHSKFSDYFPIYKAESLEKEERLRGLANSICTNEEEWSYFERQLGKYTEKFTLETKQDFIDQLRDFEQGFISYLNKQEDILSFEDRSGISEIMQQALMRYYHRENLQLAASEAIGRVYDNKASEEYVYNFINFNYTFILEKCLQTIPNGVVHKRKLQNTEIMDKIGEVIHIHGTSEEYPIMGVNDASQIAKPELAKDKRFQRYIIKPSINEAIGMNYDKDTTNLILKSTIICIYGMSLGETDRKWWDLILTWLANDRSRHLIVFDYDDKFKTTTPFDLLQKKERIIDKFTNFSFHSINADQFISRIHIAIHKNIFQMDLAKQYNEIMDMAMEMLLTTK